MKQKQIRLLNALAEIIATCEEYTYEGCKTHCPLRRPSDEQEEGFGVCAFEMSGIPLDWALSEPTSDDDILLEIYPYFEKDTEELWSL